MARLVESDAEARAESRVAEVQQRRRKRWDIPPAGYPPEEPVFELREQVAAVEARAQAQEQKMAILAESFIKILAGSIVLWAVGTEKR